MSRVYLGIDIGGTAVKLGIVDEEGTISASNSYSVNFDHYRTPIMDTVMRSIPLFLDEASIDAVVLDGIGVSATGQIDTKRGCVAGSAGHLPHWLGTPIMDILSKRYQRPVYVGNDANCAVLGEHLTGAAVGFQNVVMITVGTGIGGGIITENCLLTGTKGIAGELGHFPMKSAKQACSCGNYGCYEQYASTSALVRTVTSHLDALPLSHLKEELITGKLIFEELASGNSQLQILVDEWIQDVATGLIGLTHIFNPDLLLIGGGVCGQEKYFIEPLRKKVFQHIMPGFREKLSLKAAQLGNDAGIIGAVKHFIHA